jgi:hypothetical protein
LTKNKSSWLRNGSMSAGPDLPLLPCASGICVFELWETEWGRWEGLSTLDPCISYKLPFHRIIDTLPISWCHHQNLILTHTHKYFVCLCFSLPAQRFLLVTCQMTVTKTDWGSYSKRWEQLQSLTSSRIMGLW